MRATLCEPGHLIRHATVAVVLLLGVAASPAARACSCAAFPDDERRAVAIAFQRADVIFLGDVVHNKVLLLRVPPVRDSAFAVRKVWKGNRGIEDTIVRTAISEAACGYEFQEGTRYLVFANWDRRKGILRTNMCELNRIESQAQALMKELDRLFEAESGHL